MNPHNAPSPKTPWHAYLLLYRPAEIRKRLKRLITVGVIEAPPTLWQLELGVLRMWLRAFFRPETIGTCKTHPVRGSWRARLLKNRLIRGPFLFWEKAIAPWDHTGLGSPPSRMIRHLLGAHHDGNQFAYDLAILKATPGALESVRAQAITVIAEDSRRCRWLRDLVVFEGYHEALIDAVEDALAGEALVEPHEENDPDIGFEAYIRWCRRQPPTPLATWRAWRAGLFPEAHPQLPGTKP
jgi:hypothetical protein